MEEKSKEENPVRISFLPTSPRGLKKLRTRRRRIRNDSGGIENIRKVAVTVSFDKESNVLGLKLDVVRHVQQKLAATEHYYRDPLGDKLPQLIAHAYVLVEVLRLKLTEAPTIGYLDGDLFGAEGFAKECERGPAELFEWYEKLRDACGDVRFEYPTSGTNLEFMQRKVDAVKRDDVGGQVVGSDLAEFERRISSTESD